MENPSDRKQKRLNRTTWRGRRPGGGVSPSRSREPPQDRPRLRRDGSWTWSNWLLGFLRRFTLRGCWCMLGNKTQTIHLHLAVLGEAWEVAMESPFSLSLPEGCSVECLHVSQHGLRSDAGKGAFPLIAKENGALIFTSSQTGSRWEITATKKGYSHCVS